MSREPQHDPPPARITCHLCRITWVTPWPSASWRKHWQTRHTEGQGSK